MMSDNENTNTPQGSQDNFGQSSSNSGSNHSMGQVNKPITPESSEAERNETRIDHDHNKSEQSVKHHNKQSQPPRPVTKTKHSPLALLISLIALGAGGYALYQNLYEKPIAQGSGDLTALQNKVNQLQQALDGKANSTQLNDIEQNLTTLDQKIAEQAQQQSSGPDEAQITTLIDQQVQAQVSKAQQEWEQTLAAQQPTTAVNTGLTKEEVNTLIKEALANASAAQANNQPVVDFSNEIAAIKQDKAEIRQDKSEIQGYINSIKQEGETIHASLNSALTNAEEQLNAIGQQPIVAPLLNTLSLAEIAANTQQYHTAAQYLTLAHDNFAALNLDQAPYAQYGEQIAELAQQMQKLADSRNSQAKIDSIIAGVDEWPFIKTGIHNLLDNNGDDPATESWKSDLKRIGGNILSKTITVTKNDEASLTWINQNPYLQQLIRENMRLDLGMIRSALLLGDTVRAQNILSNVQTQSARYFDTESDTVKNALATLEQLITPSSDAPDIAALIASIKNAG